jgi:cobalt-zinc-cadmium efflux system membrane fusion protein
MRRMRTIDRISMIDSRNVWRALLLAACAAAAGLGLFGDLLAHGGEDHGEAAPVAAPAGAEPVSVRESDITIPKEQQFALEMLTEPAARREMVRSVEVTGRVVPRTEAVAEVSSGVAGRVVGGTLPRLGERVSRGQILFRVAQVLSPSEQTALRTEQIRAKAELESAEREVSRFERLEGVVAGKQIIEARIRRDAARDAYAAFSAQLSGKGASVAVTAPITGVITEAEIADGEVLDQSTVVYRIADLSKVWVEADLFEGDIARVEGAERAEIRTPSYPAETFTGTLYRFGSTVDPSARTIKALFLVDNRGERLKLNMSASVAVTVGNSGSVLAVPRDAVARRGGKSVVFIHTTPEHFQIRDVTLGAGAGEGYVEIAGGLNAGERVLVSGTYQIKQLTSSE